MKDFASSRPSWPHFTGVSTGWSISDAGAGRLNRLNNRAGFDARAGTAEQAGAVTIGRVRVQELAHVAIRQARREVGCAGAVIVVRAKEDLGRAQLVGHDLKMRATRPARHQFHSPPIFMPLPNDQHQR